MDLNSAVIAVGTGAVTAIISGVLVHHLIVRRERRAFRRQHMDASADKCIHLYGEALTVLHRVIVNTGIHTVEGEEQEIRRCEMLLLLRSTPEIVGQYRRVLAAMGEMYEQLADLPHHVAVRAMSEMERKDLLRQRGSAARKRQLIQPVFGEQKKLAEMMRAHVEEIQGDAWTS